MTRTEKPRQMRRREMMALSAGVLASAALYGCGADEDDAASPSVAGGTTATPDCVLTPEQEAGPFYIDLAQVRQDIVEDRPGLPLALALTVVDSDTCEPIRDAAVDVWHCDALGVYSGESWEGSEGETYLRGIQLTDGSGLAEFATIYPGQYPGRTTHIHVKVHTGGHQSDGTYSGGHVSHTGQLFTSDRRDAEVFALAPITGTRSKSSRATGMASFWNRVDRARCSTSHRSATASRGTASRQERRWAWIPARRPANPPGP